MSVLSKVVIGGIAFAAGILIATKDDDDSHKHGNCRCKHDWPKKGKSASQPLDTQPNSYPFQQPYSQQMSGWKAPMPVERIPIQTEPNGKKEVNIGYLDVYGGHKLFNGDLLDLPQFKDLPLLPDQIKKLLSNSYVRKAILSILERNGVDTSSFRFDEVSNPNTSQPSATSKSASGDPSIPIVHTPYDPTKPTNVVLVQHANEPVRKDQDVDQEESADADTVEHRAHSSLCVSGGNGSGLAFRYDPSVSL